MAAYERSVVAAIDRAQVRFDLKDVPEGERVRMYLNNTIVHFLEMRAGARGYQTLTNEALTKVVQHHDLEELLRRVIREELSDSKREPA